MNGISDDKIDSILVENKLRKSIDRNENINTIVKNLSFDEIDAYLSGTVDETDLIDEIKDSLLICPLKIYKGKRTLTTEKHDGSIFLLLFDSEESFNEYKKNNKSIEKLKNNMDYFKKLINKNKKIEGICVRNILIKKEQLN